MIEIVDEGKTFKKYSQINICSDIYGSLPTIISLKLLKSTKNFRKSEVHSAFQWQKKVDLFDFNKSNF